MDRDPDPDEIEVPEVLPDSPEREYFQTVERRFQQLRGSPILLSPRDWMRIASWWERGIPIGIVLAGIERAFEKRRESSPDATIRSLAYCEPVILDTWERRRQQQVAKGEAHPPLPAASWTGERLRAHFHRVGTALQGAAAGAPADLTDAIERCLGWLRQTPAGGEGFITPMRLQELEERLLSFERDIAAAARRTLPAVEIARVRSEVDDRLRPYRDMMNVDTFRETREFLLQDGFRRRLSLPRLSLFSIS